MTMDNRVTANGLPVRIEIEPCTIDDLRVEVVTTLMLDTDGTPLPGHHAKDNGVGFYYDVLQGDAHKPYWCTNHGDFATFEEALKHIKEQAANQEAK